MKKVIIFGTGGLAEIILEALIKDDKYEIVAFCVERKYLKDSFLGYPIIAFEDILLDKKFKDLYFIVAIGANSLNDLRTRIFNTFCEYGFSPISFISDKADISKTATIGKHCIIFENVVAHAKVHIGNNVIIFPNSYLGHHTSIGDNTFICAQVSLAGGCSIGENCFIGAGSTIGNCLHVGDYNVMGMRSVCTKSTDKDTMIIGNKQYNHAKERFEAWLSKCSASFRDNIIMNGEYNG